jgi:hypothetical protein
MSVCKNKGWYVASIGGLAVADRNRINAMMKVAALFLNARGVK